jgi:hypothetical protein
MRARRRSEVPMMRDYAAMRLAAWPARSKAESADETCVYFVLIKSITKEMT